MIKSDDQLIIYTDGSCINNPGNGGYAGLIIINGVMKYCLKGSMLLTTNNYMELLSVIKCLDFIACNLRCSHIVVYTDSTYVMKGAMEWMYAWRKNNWKTSAKKDVCNKELWLQLLQLKDQYNVVFNWVKAHAENHYNNFVDNVARKAAINQSIHSVDVLN